MKKKLFVLGMCLVFSFSMGNASDARKSKGDIVEDGKKVKIDYTLTVDGEVIDSTEGEQPLEYEHGKGQVIPGLSLQLEGMKKGSKKTIVVDPKQGYGLVNPTAFGEIGKSSFANTDSLQVGLPVHMAMANGSKAQGFVSAISEDKVIIDFNHSLAGKTLIFEVKVVDIE